MRFLAKKRQGASFVALFDVEATSVGVTIAHHHKGITTLVWHNRIDYSFKPEADYEHYERSMYATLLEAGMSLTSTGIRAAREAYPEITPEHMEAVCVLAPPWFFATVETVTKEWDRPTEVTSRISESMHEEAGVQAAEKPEAATWRTVVGEAEILEHTYQSHVLNGYRVQKFSGQEVLHAAVSDYVAFIGSDVLGHVREILERVLPNHTVTIRTSTSVLSDVYRATMGGGTSHHGYVVEVGGHVTSVASIRNGLLDKVNTIPLGTHDLLSAVSPDAPSAQEARSALFLLVKQTKGKENSVVIPAELEKPVSEWHKAVCAVFSSQGKGAVPYEIMYLVAPLAWTPIFTTVLSRPWIMPTIRKEHSQKVVPLSVMAEALAPIQEGEVQSAPPAPGDTRLQIFSHALLFNARA